MVIQFHECAVFNQPQYVKAFFIIVVSCWKQIEDVDENHNIFGIGSVIIRMLAYKNKQEKLLKFEFSMLKISFSKMSANIWIFLMLIVLFIYVSVL